MPTDKRVAYVTGGSRGIGEAIVLALAAAGFHVVAVARNREKLDAVVRAAADKAGPGGGASKPKSSTSPTAPP